MSVVFRSPYLLFIHKYGTFLIDPSYSMIILYSLCLAKHAEHRGQAFLGGTLMVDNWIEYVHDKNSTVKVDILIAANVNIPVRAYARGSKGKQYPLQSIILIGSRPLGNSLFSFNIILILILILYTYSLLWIAGAAIDEWWNFTDNVHHDAFIIPTVCTRAEQGKNSPTTLQAAVGRVAPITLDSAFWKAM